MDKFELTKVKTVKYLGITVDENLTSWDTLQQVNLIYILLALILLIKKKLFA